MVCTDCNGKGAVGPRFDSPKPPTITGPTVVEPNGRVAGEAPMLSPATLEELRAHGMMALPTGRPA